MAKEVMVEISARHVHVSQKDLEILFGEGYTLTPKKDLSQPGQFACEEKVTVVGPKGSLKASILGPCRPDDQVELSLTDARTIGVVAPVRESGDIAGSGACKLVGPAGEVEIEIGVIAAKRHIHMTPADAEAAGFFVDYELPVKGVATRQFAAKLIVNAINATKVKYSDNVATEQYVDMFAAGIVDPTKVTRSALQNAASIASVVLTTESVVADKKDPAAEAAANAAMAGAGGTGGMY